MPSYRRLNPKSYRLRDTKKKKTRKKRDDDLILKLFKTLQSLSPVVRSRPCSATTESKVKYEEKEGGRWVSVSVSVCTSLEETKTKISTLDKK